MGEPRRGLGQAILNGIIKEGLVRAECEDLCVWNANADEMLEAIVADFQQNAQRCVNCGTFALLGQWGLRGFVCCDCLPPDEA